MFYLKQLLWKGAASLSGGNVGKGYTVHRAILYILGLAWWENGVKYRIGNFILIIFYLIHLYSLLYNPINIKIDNAAAFTVMVSDMVITVVFISGGLKHFSLFVLRKRLQAMIQYMEEELTIGESILPGGIFITVYGIALGTTASGWIFNGLILKGGDLLFDENFPWDESGGYGLLAALGYQSLACNLVWLEHFCVDTIPTITCYKLYENIEKLKTMLVNIGSGGVNDRAKLKEAVELHLKILKSVRLLNNTYEYILLFQTIYLVIHSCIIIYCVIKVDSFGFIITSLAPLLISAYAQLFVYCRTGQLLTSKMDDLTNCCYSNLWYLAPPDVRRSLVLIMMCAKKPVLFKSFSITAALYATYLKGVQESFSYFIFLRTVESNMMRMNEGKRGKEISS